MIAPDLNNPDLRRMAQAVRELSQGGTNAAGTFTLAQGQTQTIVDSPQCGENSLPLATPWSATAAAAGLWVKSVARGRFIVGHAAAGVGAVFRYELRQP